MWVGRSETEITALAFAPDGRVLYTGDDAGRVRAWDFSPTFTEFPPLACARSRAPRIAKLWAVGERIVASSQSGVQILDLSTGTWAPLLTDEAVCYNPGVSADGSVIAGSGSGPPRFWDARTRRPLAVPPEVVAVERATVTDFTADGSGLLLYSSTAGRAWIWDVPGKKMRCELNPAPGMIYPWALSRDGSTAAIDHAPRVFIYDLSTGRRRRAPMIQLGDGTLALDPSGRTLAVANSLEKGIVGLWETKTGRLRERFDWRIGPVACLAFSPDGLTGAAGGKKGVVVWDVGG